MDFTPSPRAQATIEAVTRFMEERVYPAEAVFDEEIRASGDPHHHPAVMEELKAEARSRGLWNLFHPDPAWGAGLTNVDYAPIAELLGRSHIGPEACNCNAPDTGNMEVLSRFGTPEQQDTWLRPLLAGEIRSGFAMTEPAVASSDATNISLRIRRDGDGYVLNGRKWWTTNAWHPNCRILIVMGKTDPDGPPHRQQSQIPCRSTRPASPASAASACSATSTPRATRRSRSTTCASRPRTSSGRRATASSSARPASAPAASTTACG
jgi:acyl-CoA dehydrogenase